MATPSSSPVFKPGSNLLTAKKPISEQEELFGGRGDDSVRAIKGLTRAVEGLAEKVESIFDMNDLFRSVELIKNKLTDLERKINNIMSAISDFAAAQTAFNDKIDAAVTGLTGDIQTLNDKIAELQKNPGPITPEDQKLLDDIQARSGAIAAKLEALDALTPPVVPPGPV